MEPWRKARMDAIAILLQKVDEVRENPDIPYEYQRLIALCLLHRVLTHLTFPEFELMVLCYGSD
jgi:hypothetical protein